MMSFFTKRSMLNKIPMTLGVVLASYFIITFAVVAFLRAGFPFDMEWAEGIMVDQIRRLLAGYPLYSDPSLDNIPFPYTPVYIYMGALLSKVFGIGYAPLRIINIVSTMGCMLLLWLFVKRETGKSHYGIIAAGLFAATYKINAYWFDLARVDMLFIFFVIWAAYLVRYGKNSRDFVIAGLLSVLAFFTKQTALGPIVALMIYSIIFRRPYGWWFCGVFLVCSVSAVLVFNSIYDGWFWYYTYTFPSHHGIISSRLRTFWYRDLLFPLFSMLTASVFYLVSCRGKHGKNQFWFVLLFFGSLFSVSFLSRIKIGGAANTLIPLHLGASLLTGYAFGCILEHGKVRNRFSVVKELTLVVLVLIQLSMGLYNPVRFVPSEKGVIAGEKALETISEIEGDVWVVRFNNLTSRLGKGYGAHTSILNDIFKVRETEREFRKKLTDPLINKEYKAIIVKEGSIPKFARNIIEKNYKRTDKYIKVIQWQTDYGWYFSREDLYVPK